MIRCFLLLSFAIRQHISFEARSRCQVLGTRDTPQRHRDLMVGRARLPGGVWLLGKHELPNVKGFNRLDFIHTNFRGDGMLPKIANSLMDNASILVFFKQVFIFRVGTLLLEKILRIMRVIFFITYMNLFTILIGRFWDDLHENDDLENEIMRSRGSNNCITEHAFVLDNVSRCARSFLKT